MSEDIVYQTKADIPQAHTGRDVLFGPGHTYDLKQLLPGIHIQQGAETHIVGDSNNPPLLTLAPEAMSSYIKSNEENNPHAIEIIIQITCEEVKQITDPQRTVQSLVSCTIELGEQRKLGEMGDPDEIKYLENAIVNCKDQLKSCFTLLPQQVAAIQAMLSHEEFNILLDNYLSKYGTQMRTDTKGRETGLTHTEFIEKNLQETRDILERRNLQVKKAMEDMDQALKDNPTLLD